MISSSHCSILLCAVKVLPLPLSRVARRPPRVGVSCAAKANPRHRHRGRTLAMRDGFAQETMQWRARGKRLTDALGRRGRPPNFGTVTARAKSR
eukprot:2244704-Pyramimonas_sp.AAC.1